MSTTELVAFGWGRLRPLGGDRCRGMVRLLWAAEMRPKKSGSDAGGGGGGGGRVLRRGRLPCRAGRISGARGRLPRVVPPGRWWGGERVNVPPTRAYWPLFHGPPQSARRLSAGCFGGLGLSGPSAEEGRVPSVLGGAAHRRDTGGPEAGRA